MFQNDRIEAFASGLVDLVRSIGGGGRWMPPLAHGRMGLETIDRGRDGRLGQTRRLHPCHRTHVEFALVDEPAEERLDPAEAVVGRRRRTPVEEIGDERLNVLTTDRGYRVWHGSVDEEAGEQADCRGVGGDGRGTDTRGRQQPPPGGGEQGDFGRPSGILRARCGVGLYQLNVSS